MDHWDLALDICFEDPTNQFRVFAQFQSMEFDLGSNIGYGINSTVSAQASFEDGVVT
jgi:hypothetical protein